MKSIPQSIRAALLLCLAVLALGAGKPIKITVRNLPAKEVVMMYAKLVGEAVAVPTELQSTELRVKELDVNTDDKDVAKAAIADVLERDVGNQIVRGSDGNLHAVKKK